jgi:DNA-binding LacI/PurR family transcriptional regulator
MAERSEKIHLKPKRVTLGDVAVAAGLAKTTVSDILNRQVNGRYSAATRDKVMRAVETLGYAPARAAQMLASGRSGQVGLFLTRDFSNPFFARIAHLAQQNLQTAGYRMQLAVDDGDEEREAKTLRSLRSDGVEGVIIGPIYEKIDLEIHRSIFRGQMPLVTFGGELESEFDCVAIDAIAGQQLAVNHLREMGHQTIAYLMAPPPRTNDDRSRSVVPPLIRAGFDARWIINHQDTGNYDDFFAVAQQFIAEWKAAPRENRPTAVACLNDQVALTLIAAATRAGLNVPADLSVIGTDNLPGSAYFTPGLTTIENRADRVIETAIKLLEQRLAEPDSPVQRIRIKPELVTRQSVARRIV